MSELSSEPHLVIIPEKACLNCLYAHYVDDDYGWCDWFRGRKLPTPLADPPDLLLDRKTPYTNCPAWQPRLMTKRMGV